LVHHGVHTRDFTGKFLQRFISAGGPLDATVTLHIVRAEHGPQTETNRAMNQTARVLILALLSALLLFPSLRRTGLAGYDDAYWAHEGKEMVRSADWWSVCFNGKFTLEHPPLFPWLEATSFKLFGIADWAAKFPTAVLGLATILLLYFLALELTGDSWLALLSMLVLASTQFFLKNATHAMTDVPFTFFFTLSVYFYLKGRKNPRYLALAGLPLAAAVLTRSMVGFLALGIMLLHLVFTREYKLFLSPWLLFGVVIALVFPCSWYFSQYRLHGAQFLLSHFQFVSGLLHANYASPARLPVSNYLLALLKYYWPWLPFLVGGLIWQTRAAIKEQERSAMLLLIWILVVIVPFSFAQTKMPRYMMPVLPAFSILSAIALNRIVPTTRRKVFFNSACAVGCLAICFSLLFPPKSRADDIIQLAPVAEASTPADRRVLFYTYEDGREDYLWQFIWYSNRYGQLAANLGDLAATLRQTDHATVITDKPSYEKLLPLLSGRTPTVLAESQNLMCFHLP
jgi:4-amino-4-deoxy-L-arabinose transferase-like glycosyltransferase